ncbi:MAG: DNA alkylation repair protein [Cyanobacteria bacterium P01_A01_bin.37]
MKAKSSFSLKDQLFNPHKVEYLGGLISQIYTAFDQAAFQHAVVKEFPELELKERIAHIATCLHRYLPNNYLIALEIILSSLPPALDPTKTDDDFGDFIFAPLSLFVATYGCTQDYLEVSLQALKEITKRFSAEDAIRYFINTFPDETCRFLFHCAQDDNYHVRRLASEGTRPKLPWSQKLIIDYRQPLPILGVLFADKTRYVTRSVANHLNDISKVDSPLVIETLNQWHTSGKQTVEEMKFITQHGLRSLIKQGDPQALALLGFGTKPDIKIIHFVTDTSVVKVGEAFRFSLELRANQAQNLLVDYLMIFATDGKKQPQKVFKLKQLELKAGEVVKLQKRHPMRLMTTRRLVLGEHRIILQVNGQPFDSLSFELVESS